MQNFINVNRIIIYFFLFFTMNTYSDGQSDLTSAVLRDQLDTAFSIAKANNELLSGTLTITDGSRGSLAAHLLTKAALNNRWDIMEWLHETRSNILDEYMETNIKNESTSIPVTQFFIINLWTKINLMPLSVIEWFHNKKIGLLNEPIPGYNCSVAAYLWIVFCEGADRLNNLKWLHAIQSDPNLPTQIVTPYKDITISLATFALIKTAKQQGSDKQKGDELETLQWLQSIHSDVLKEVIVISDDIKLDGAAYAWKQALKQKNGEGLDTMKWLFQKHPTVLTNVISKDEEDEYESEGMLVSGAVYAFKNACKDDEKLAMLKWVVDVYPDILTEVVSKTSNEELSGAIYAWCAALKKDNTALETLQWIKLKHPQIIDKEICAWNKISLVTYAWKEAAEKQGCLNILQWLHGIRHEVLTQDIKINFPDRTLSVAAYALIKAAEQNDGQASIEWLYQEAPDILTEKIKTGESDKDDVHLAGMEAMKACAKAEKGIDSLKVLYSLCEDQLAEKTRTHDENSGLATLILMAASYHKLAIIQYLYEKNKDVLSEVATSPEGHKSSVAAILLLLGCRNPEGYVINPEGYVINKTEENIAQWLLEERPLTIEESVTKGEQTQPVAISAFLSAAKAHRVVEMDLLIRHDNNLLTRQVTTSRYIGTVAALAFVKAVGHDYPFSNQESVEWLLKASNNQVEYEYITDRESKSRVDVKIPALLKAAKHGRTASLERLLERALELRTQKHSQNGKSGSPIALALLEAVLNGQNWTTYRLLKKHSELANSIINQDNKSVNVIDLALTSVNKKLEDISTPPKKRLDLIALIKTLKMHQTQTPTIDESNTARHRAN